MNYNIDTIIQKLQNNIFSEFANKIKNAEDNSFTSTTLLMSVGSQLKYIAHHHQKTFSIIRLEVEEYFNYCKSVGIILEG